jgi:GH15 family glucan-1,4-alpha-glucosidase
MREILRIVEGVEGSVDLEIDSVPRPNYARAQIANRRQAGIGWRCSWSNQLILLQSDVELREQNNGLHRRFQIDRGQRQYLSLAFTEADIGTVAPLTEADARYDATTKWWRDWADQCEFNGAEREAVVRSALTLKLLTFCLSGAVVSAPTTSLPEAIGGKRNWDYRYCWLRDSGLTMEALLSLGFHNEASAYLGWLLHSTRLTRPKLKILYDVYGRSYVRERHLDFAGYRRSRPVRVGNDAILQTQHDTHGQVIAAAEAFVAAGYQLDANEARMLAGFGDVICRTWHEPDNGIWEIPWPRRHYTFSKVMCWVALSKLLCLHDRGAIRIGSRVSLYQRVSADIAACIEERGFNHELNCYTSELDGHDMDAAMLLMVFFGYRDAGHPRMTSTYEAIQRRLGQNRLLRRYRPGYDEMKDIEGAFGICSFLAVDHLAKRGLIRQAEEYFEYLCSFANDVGLFGEETDPDSGALLGNFPQGFSHVGLIQAALALEKARGRCHR